MSVAANFKTVVTQTVDLKNGIISDGDASGIVDTITIGTAVSQFELLYPGASFQYLRASASSESTGPAVCMALESASSGSIKALFFGKVRNDSWNWSVGSVFLDTTTGSMTQTAPSGTGNTVQAIGYAIDADTLFLKFSRTVVVLS